MERTINCPPAPHTPLKGMGVSASRDRTVNRLTPNWVRVGEGRMMSVSRAAELVSDAPGVAILGAQLAPSAGGERPAPGRDAARCASQGKFACLGAVC